MVAIRYINDTAPPIEPAQDGYKVNKADLYSDATGRSAETGKLLQYLVRKNVYTIELTYQGTVAQIAGIEALIDGTNLKVEFLDDSYTTYKTKYMYPSDRAKEIKSLKDGGKVTLSFSLIEI